MTTLVKTDDKGRIPLRGSKKQSQYLVTAARGGWWIMPAPKIEPPIETELPRMKIRREKNGWVMLAKPLDKTKVRAAIRAERERLI